jgi:hypothetical protein
VRLEFVVKDGAAEGSRMGISFPEPGRKKDSEDVSNLTSFIFVKNS